MSPEPERTGPPYPVWPVIREQGLRFWLQVAGSGLLAVAFVGFFGWRAFVGGLSFPDVDQHADDLRVHEQHIER